MHFNMLQMSSAWVRLGTFVAFCSLVSCHVSTVCKKGTEISVFVSQTTTKGELIVQFLLSAFYQTPTCLWFPRKLCQLPSFTYLLRSTKSSVSKHGTSPFSCFPGDHDRGHGGTAGLWPGQRSRLRRDGRAESEAGSRTAGLFQIRKAADDPHEEPLGRKGVERPLERQVHPYTATYRHGCTTTAARHILSCLIWPSSSISDGGISLFCSYSKKDYSCKANG